MVFVSGKMYLCRLLCRFTSDSIGVRHFYVFKLRLFAAGRSVLRRYAPEVFSTARGHYFIGMHFCKERKSHVKEYYWILRYPRAS